MRHAVAARGRKAGWRKEPQDYTRGRICVEPIGGTQASETVHGTILRPAVANTLKEHMLLDDYATFVLSALPCALLQDVRLLTRQNHDFAKFRRVSQSFCEIMSVLLRFSARLNIASW